MGIPISMFNGQSQNVSASASAYARHVCLRIITITTSPQGDKHLLLSTSEHVGCNHGCTHPTSPDMTLLLPRARPMVSRWCRWLFAAGTKTQLLSSGTKHNLSVCCIVGIPQNGSKVQRRARESWTIKVSSPKKALPIFSSWTVASCRAVIVDEYGTGSNRVPLNNNMW